MTLYLTRRELATYLAIGVTACLLIGAGIAIATITIITSARDDQRAAEIAMRVEIAYAQGAMIAIARRKLNCSEYELRDGKAVCK